MSCFLLKDFPCLFPTFSDYLILWFISSSSMFKVTTSILQYLPFFRRDRGRIKCLSKIIRLNIKKLYYEPERKVKIAKDRDMFVMQG